MKKKKVNHVQDPLFKIVFLKIRLHLKHIKTLEFKEFTLVIWKANLVEQLALCLRYCFENAYRIHILCCNLLSIN